jgi:hypothetical protein
MTRRAEEVSFGVLEERRKEKRKKEAPPGP